MLKTPTKYAEELDIDETHLAQVIEGWKDRKFPIRRILEIELNAKLNSLRSKVDTVKADELLLLQGRILGFKEAMAVLLTFDDAGINKDKYTLSTHKKTKK